jgi:hypothetical protein
MNIKFLRAKVWAALPSTHKTTAYGGQDVLISSKEGEQLWSNLDGLTECQLINLLPPAEQKRIYDRLER